MVSETREQLLEPEFMAALERLDIVSRKIFAGRMKGERRSKRKGESVEFADYRNYVVGDDLRFLDWNVYGRLERLFIKLFLAEEDLHVSVLIDASGSMEWGEPSKSMYARRIAAALTYIGLVRYDRMTVAAFGDGLRGELAGIRGRRQMHRVIGFLNELEFEGEGDFGEACRQFVIRHPHKGVLIVLSDFLDKGGFEAGLRYLTARNLDIYVLHMLSPEEIEPQLAGDLRLVDVEDEDTAEVTVSRALLNRYRSNLQAANSGAAFHRFQRDLVGIAVDTYDPGPEHGVATHVAPCCALLDQSGDRDYRVAGRGRGGAFLETVWKLFGDETGGQLAVAEPILGQDRGQKVYVVADAPNGEAVEGFV